MIMGNDLLTSQQQIKQALPMADVIELRLDYWEKLEISAIKVLCQGIALPIIMTLRKKTQGGHCQLPEKQRLQIMHQLAEMGPEYIDLEYDVPQEWLTEFRCRYPAIQLIGSYHDFNETPHDLLQLWQSIFNPLFDIFKIALFARDICDTLRLLIFFKSINQQHRSIGIAMGEDGQISRVLAPVTGSVFTYGCVETNLTTAPGQLTLAELTEIYRVNLLNADTEIYSLIGDPISQSPGHLVHNRAFSLLKKNAVYVKCRVKAEKLVEAMSLLRQLPFYGFSITIPHKEAVAPLVDELFAEAALIKIVNTIKCEHHRYLGFNTDAVGAASVLEARVSLKNQRVLILGAGGSAKAIAYILLEKGSKITLCNRTLSRAKDFTREFGGKSIDFNLLFSSAEFPYDIIINTLPATAFAQQCADWKIPKVAEGIAMDIILKPLETPFIQLAKTAGWQCITGEALFTEQGLRQLKIWFNYSALPEAVRNEAFTAKNLNAILFFDSI